MDKSVSYTYGGLSQGMVIKVEIICDHEEKLLPQIENVLLKSLDIIDDLRLKENEDELSKVREEQYCKCAEIPPVHTYEHGICTTCAKKIKP
jgi:hypothetical protein